MKVHLYEFDYKGERLYVFTTIATPDEIRQIWTVWDQGGMDFDVFEKVWTEGTCREIISPEQVNEDDYLDHIPFCTGERVNCPELGGNFFYIEDTIHGFFLDYYGKEF